MQCELLLLLLGLLMIVMQSYLPRIDAENLLTFSSTMRDEDYPIGRTINLKMNTFSHDMLTGQRQAVGL